MQDPLVLAPEDLAAHQRATNELAMLTGKLTLFQRHQAAARLVDERASLERQVGATVSSIEMKQAEIAKIESRAPQALLTGQLLDDGHDMPVLTGSTVD